MNSIAIPFCRIFIGSHEEFIGSFPGTHRVPVPHLPHLGTAYCPAPKQLHIHRVARPQVVEPLHTLLPRNGDLYDNSISITNSIAS